MRILINGHIRYDQVKTYYYESVKFKNDTFVLVRPNGRKHYFGANHIKTIETKE